jgi:hypothetical protein
MVPCAVLLTCAPVQFKFKGRGVHKFLLGHATVAIRDLVREVGRMHDCVAQGLPLHGAGVALQIEWSWEPITQYRSAAED